MRRDFLGVGADEVAMVRNVTQATAVVLSNLAAQRPARARRRGRPRRAGLRVGTSQRAHWCERSGASCAVVTHPVDVDDAGIVGCLVDAACAEVAARGDRVALVIVDQITSPTGALLPAAAICAPGA